jgi:hypothetical protein
MRTWISAGVVSAALFGASIWARAQVQVPNGPRVPGQTPSTTIISGGDIGFRVDGVEADGPVGRWVIKVDGKWVEPKVSGGVRRLATH